MAFDEDKFEKEFNEAVLPKPFKEGGNKEKWLKETLASTDEEIKKVSDLLTQEENFHLSALAKHDELLKTLPAHEEKEISPEKVLKLEAKIKKFDKIALDADLYLFMEDTAGLGKDSAGNKNPALNTFASRAEADKAREPARAKAKKYRQKLKDYAGEPLPVKPDKSERFYILETKLEILKEKRAKLLAWLG